MPLVWAIDEVHLPHYLVPRECPRVCWVAQGTAGALASHASRVVAVEREWLAYLRDCRLTVHRLDPAGFTLLDAAAGYWTSEQLAKVLQVHTVEDCAAELMRHGVELRLVSTLWPLLDIVAQAGVEFSAIRMRNAKPVGS